jgi:hypothetical protein
MASDVPAYPAVLLIVLGYRFNFYLYVCGLSSTAYTNVVMTLEIMPYLLLFLVVVYVINK